MVANFYQELATKKTRGWGMAVLSYTSPKSVSMFISNSLTMSTMSTTDETPYQERPPAKSKGDQNMNMN